MAGHSKWSNIKHRKGKADAQRGKIFAKVAREIIVAVKQGGEDPDINFALRLALDKARSFNVPNENINRAIQRGLGGAEGDNYDEFSYEGYGPGGVAIMVDLLSDNRNRTASDIRHIFSKYGGNLGENGSVAYLFDHRGLIIVERKPELNYTEDEMLLLALEAGAEDLNVETDSFEIITAIKDLQTVRDSLHEQSVPIASAELTMIPQTLIAVEGKVAETVLKLLEALEDHDDVQNVHTNVDLPDDEA